MIFSRGRGSGRHVRDDQDRGEPDPVDDGTAADLGPYDVTQAPRGVRRLDLGALQIPAVEGVEVRVQADPDGTIQQVVLVHEESALQLGVFAAPRSEGIWDEVRAEIRQSLFDDGVAAEEVPGEYGVELRARVRTPDGLTDLRFVGVDGPRWMVRGVFQGRAAVDPAAAGPLLDCLHGLVVNRGTEAKPVREPLLLRLPREMTEQAQRPQQEPQPPAGVNGAVPPPRSSGGQGSQAGRRPSPRPRRRG